MWCDWTEINRHVMNLTLKHLSTAQKAYLKKYQVLSNKICYKRDTFFDIDYIWMCKYTDYSCVLVHTIYTYIMHLALLHTLVYWMEILVSKDTILYTTLLQSYLLTIQTSCGCSHSLVCVKDHTDLNELFGSCSALNNTFNGSDTLITLACHKLSTYKFV